MQVDGAQFEAVIHSCPDMNRLIKRVLCSSPVVASIVSGMAASVVDASTLRACANEVCEAIAWISSAIGPIDYDDVCNVIMLDEALPVRFRAVVASCLLPPVITAKVLRKEPQDGEVEPFGLTIITDRSIDDEVFDIPTDKLQYVVLHERLRVGYWRCRTNSAVVVFLLDCPQTDFVHIIMVRPEPVHMTVERRTLGMELRALLI